MKFISDAKTDKILGAHILGPNAGELIGECVMAMEYGGSTEVHIDEGYRSWSYCL